jgi:dTDP-glucose 4,6-dehydratase
MAEPAVEQICNLPNLSGRQELCPTTNPLGEDLDHVLAHTAGLWEELRGRRLFITGGTGFFGCWLLESFAWANDRLGLDAEAVVLTRNPDAFAGKAPHLAGHPAISLHAGDVRSFAFPHGPFVCVVHAATETGTAPGVIDPLALFDTIVQGTRRALEFARVCGARQFLLTSSGAVYGRQPPGLDRLAENHPGAPEPADPRSAYAEGKRAAEQLGALYHARFGLETKIARCFAFVGPHLPLDGPFAAGNFLRDGLRGGPVRVGGDGTPYRSYLYAADLAAWLWTILSRGVPCRPYNVGGDEPVTIAELARRVARPFDAGVHVARPAEPGRAAERYVPDVSRARDELGLRSWVPLDEALGRTVRWHRERRLPPTVYCPPPGEAPWRRPNLP